MRNAVALLIAAVGLAACGSSSLTGSHASPTPVASATATSTTSPSPSAPALVDPASYPKLTGSYGLLYSRMGTNGLSYLLHLVKSDATLEATVGMQWADGAIYCGGNTDSADVPPPVSASNRHVYFREGSLIKMVVLPSTSVAVTTVPDSRTVVSTFSVSPDDQRIAVAVVDVSQPSTITTRLYVEDLVGHGHHADIYTLTAARTGATTLWPMGWHQGNLVLAVAPACTLGIRDNPTEWHVSSPTTAVRVATINAPNCLLSFWPSPAGVACAQPSGPTTLYGWNGKVLGVTGPGSTSPVQVSATGLSPAGQSIYFSGGLTRIVQLGPGPYATVQGTDACGWIDEDHLLSTTSVIQFPAETPGNVQVTATTTPLPQSGQPDPSTPQTSGCAGRFPGAL